MEFSSLGLDSEEEPAVKGFSPELARVALGYGVALKPEVVAEFGMFDVFDAYALRAEMFVAPAAAAPFIARAQQIAVCASTAQRVSPLVVEPRQRAEWHLEWYQAPKNGRKPSFDPSAMETISSGKSGEASARLALAGELIALMSDEVQEAFFEGITRPGAVPDQVKSELMLRSVSGLAGADTLRGARDALKRLGTWMATKFSRLHGFYAMLHP